MTLIASVFDIIMDQRKIVDELDGCGSRHYLRRVTSHHLTTKKAKGRANKFARFSVTGMSMLILPAHMIS
jgi:hypothetical protein